MPQVQVRHFVCIMVCTLDLQSVCEILRRNMAAVHLNVAQLEFEDLAMLWLHGVDKKVNVTGREGIDYLGSGLGLRDDLFGAYDTLIAELERESNGDFVGFLQMEPAMFRELLDRVTPRLTKQHTQMRQPLEPGLTLAIALSYFASGNSYRNLVFSFRVAHNTISGILKEVGKRLSTSSVKRSLTVLDLAGISITSSVPK